MNTLIYQFVAISSGMQLKQQNQLAVLELFDPAPRQEKEITWKDIIIVRLTD